MLQNVHHSSAHPSFEVETNPPSYVVSGMFLNLLVRQGAKIHIDYDHITT